MKTPQTLQTLNVIGAGRVGQTLAHLWHMQQVFAVQQVLTRSLRSASDACAFIGAGQPTATLHDLRAVDVWMLAVPDAALAQAATDLAAHAQAAGLPPAVVFHCSGALTAAHLAPLVTLGWQVASAHCILSFAAPASAVQQFPGTACALEGQPQACATLRDAFTRIGARCFDVASEHKVLYHAAAVFATNFLPVLQTVAEDAWRATGVPAELIPSLRSSLLANAVANIHRLGPAGALTGPAARGDVAAIARQAQVVTEWDPQAGAAYEALSALALRMTNTTNDTSATQATTN
jgi:predicted short-subunit dehydrogenase-like oxidoreductase (DUF2520 family)